MVNVRVRHDTKQLFLDFRYRGVRCRELTALKDSAANRKRLQALASAIQREIAQGTFDYAAHFPGSQRAQQFAQAPMAAEKGEGREESAPLAGADRPTTPTFAGFAAVWFGEMSPQWKPSHRRGVQEVLDKNLLPTFGSQPLHLITKADVLAFRAQLAKQPGRKAATLGPGRINKIMCFLRQILNEAADRFDFTPAFRGIKALKQPRSDVHPFTLEDVQRMLATIREDYRDYLTVRFFTGLRTGEINGLKWKHIDLDNNLILVREAVGGTTGVGDLKTMSSWRDITMQPMVRAAIERRLDSRVPGCPWVFSSKEGNPIDAHNFCNRIWYPLLRYLGLELRRPYQTRHTAATLMLAAGESPEWIAQTLGHSTTAMLFKVYSRFVPNLTRQDGRAFTGLVNSRMGPRFGDNSDGSPSAPVQPAAAASGSAELISALSALSADELAAIVARAQATRQ